MRDKNKKIGYAVSQILVIGDIIARGSQLKKLKFSGSMLSTILVSASALKYTVLYVFQCSGIIT